MLKWIALTINQPRVINFNFKNAQEKSKKSHHLIFNSISYFNLILIPFDE